MSEQCNSSGPGARCFFAQGASTGACAEATNECASGYRYSRSAPNAGSCVENVPDATGADADATVSDVPGDIALDIPRLDVPSDVPSQVDTFIADSGIACTPLVVPEFAPPPRLAPLLDECGIQIVSPMSQQLNTGRKINFGARFGNMVTNATVEVTRLSSMALRAASLNFPGGGGVQGVPYVETNPSVYALQWRVQGICQARPVETRLTTLALPRPFDFRPAMGEANLCPNGPDLCSSPLAPIAANIDVNNDGSSDIVVGQPRHLTIQRGTRDPMGPTIVSRICLQTSQTYLGRNIEAAGDLDGDGFSDFLLSGCTLSDPSANCGQPAVAYGGVANGIESVILLPAVAIPASRADCKLGATLRAGGDINGDGYADALIGGPCSNGGVIGVVLGSPMRAPALELLDVGSEPLATISAEPEFARAFSFIGVRTGRFSVAVLSTQAVHLLHISANRTVAEIPPTWAVGAETPFFNLRWQGLTGEPATDPGALAVTRMSEASSGGEVLAVRFNVIPMSIQADALFSGSLGQRHGAYLAGPIDLNNDGRSDVLWASGGAGTLGYNPGGRGFVTVPFIPMDDAQNIKAIASIGNAFSSLVDSFAVNVQDSSSSVVRFCQRNDEMDVPVAIPSLTCPIGRRLTLGLNSPATIAGR